MKITKTQLKQIIKEELGNVMAEAATTDLEHEAELVIEKAKLQKINLVALEKEELQKFSETVSALMDSETLDSMDVEEEVMRVLKLKLELGNKLISLRGEAGFEKNYHATDFEEFFRVVKQIEKLPQSEDELYDAYMLAKRNPK